MALAENDVREVYDRELETFKRATVRLKELLADLLQDLRERYGVREGVQITGEPKGFPAFYAKVRERGVSDVEKCTEAVRDFARARVVVQTLDDVYGLVDLLEAQDTVVAYSDTVQDYIKNPQERGYRGYHVDVGVDVSKEGKTQTVLCELQIRTAIQEAWGGFSHKDFYKGKATPAVFEDQMQEMSALLASVDRMAASLIKHLVDTSQSGGGPANAAAPAPAGPRKPEKPAAKAEGGKKGASRGKARRTSSGGGGTSASARRTRGRSNGSKKRRQA